MNRKTILLWGTIAFVLLLVLAVVWYRERVVFIDIAYHLFYILEEGTFTIQNGRFGAALTQLFPLAGAALGLPIQVVSGVYSASFIILPAGVFALLIGPLRNARMALAYLLFVVGMLTHTFFWTQSELPQTLAFLALFAGVLEGQLSRESSSWRFWAGTLLLLFTICFSNPLSPVAFFYLLFFFALRFPQKRRLLARAGTIFLLFWVVKSLFFRYPYDQQSMKGLKNFVKLFPHYFNLQSNKNFLRYFLHDYYVVGLLGLGLSVLYFRRRAWLPLALFLSFFIGYTALVNISNPGGADQFYAENQYLLLGFFVALPAAYDLFPSIRKRGYSQLLLGTIVLSCVFRIALVQPFYAQRLHWYQNVLDQTEPLPNRKIILPPEAAPLDTLLMTWASSYEFWLLSILNGGPARSLIVEERAGEFDASIERNKTFITKWFALDYAELKGPYFPFTDTSAYVKWPAGKPLSPIP